MLILFSFFARAAHHATGTFTRNTTPPPKQLHFHAKLSQTIANLIVRNKTGQCFYLICCCGDIGGRVLLILFSFFARAAHHATGTFTRNTTPPPKQLHFHAKLSQTIANFIVRNKTGQCFYLICCCGDIGGRVLLILFSFFARTAHHATGTFTRNTTPPPKQLHFHAKLSQTIANSIVRNNASQFFDLFRCCGDIGGRVLLILFSFFCVRSPSCNKQHTTHNYHP